jgi:hypothetical protein
LLKSIGTIPELKCRGRLKRLDWLVFSLSLAV